MTVRDDILKEARSRFGVPYRIDPPPDGVNNLDCSLYVLQVLKAAGVPLPAYVRTAEQIRQATAPVPFADVLPGDLLFFENTYNAAGPAGPDGKIASHIGISLGAGTQRMYDANDAHGTGETLIGTTYWQTKLFEARRPQQLVGAEFPAAMLRGVDVSSWQGNPDWRAVAASGISFAITKATQGTGYLNPTFARNWLEIKAAGMTRGAYHYADIGTNTPTAEADYFLNNVLRMGPLLPGDLLALDLEPTQPVANLGAWAMAWLKHVEMNVGFRPLVYTGAWVVNEQELANTPALGGYPLWLAAYQAAMPPAPAPWSEISIWQHSDKGSVAGIAGGVDLNRFNGDAAALEALGKGGAVEPVPVYAQPGQVGTGLLEMMAADGTAPALPSTWLPLGSQTATVEECIGLNGTRYAYHLPTGKRWRYPAA